MVFKHGIMGVTDGNGVNQIDITFIHVFATLLGQQKCQLGASVLSNAYIYLQIHKPLCTNAHIH